MPKLEADFFMQPSTPAQKQAATLLRAADRGMETAESLVKHSPHLYESMGFSCQQAVEKYSKAALIVSSQPAPFIHVLVKLPAPLATVATTSLNATELPHAVTLQDFAIELRYETDNAPSFTSADLLVMADGFRQKLRPLAHAFLI